jgi:hypothetical protein
MNVAGDYLDFRQIAVHQRGAHRHRVGSFQRRSASARSQSPLNHLANRSQAQRILGQQGIDKYRRISWLAFLDTYRTLCVAPDLTFRWVFEELRMMRLAA